jgi:23S rRNA pseudouridine1911/1915/1917 synthase
MDILYEDNHLLFVNKPAGLLTQPTEECDQSLESLAKAYIKERYEKKGNVYLHAVHRLDKETSGIVLFAKTSKALSRMNEAMRLRQIQKYYMALIEGTLKEKKGTLTHHLSHGSHKAELGFGKESVLVYRVLKEGDGLSLVEVELETGRYHQIRAQFAARGHPIVGDKKYGSTYPFASSAIALCHYKMICEHPVSHKELIIESQPPL